MPNQRVRAYLTVNLTRKELELIRKRAEFYGLNLSAYCRKLATGTRFRDLVSQRTIIDLYETREALLTAVNHLESGVPGSGKPERTREKAARRQLTKTVAATVETIERLALQLGEDRNRKLKRISPRFTKSKRGIGSDRPSSRKQGACSNRKGNQKQ